MSGILKGRTQLALASIVCTLLAPRSAAAAVPPGHCLVDANWEPQTGVLEVPAAPVGTSYTWGNLDLAHPVDPETGAVQGDRTIPTLTIYSRGARTCSDADGPAWQLSFLERDLATQGYAIDLSDVKVLRVDRNVFALPTGGRSWNDFLRAARPDFRLELGSRRFQLDPWTASDEPLHLTAVDSSGLDFDSDGVSEVTMRSGATLSIGGSNAADIVDLRTLDPSVSTDIGLFAGDDSWMGPELSDTQHEIQADQHCNQTVSLGAGNDHASGGAGSECIYGDLGSDTITGGAGDDRLSGTCDPDQGPYSGDDCRSSVGKQNDSPAACSQLVPFPMQPGLAHVHENIDGGAGDDRLWGSSGYDDLSGGLGNDTILGFAGNDSLVGGPGDDVLEAGSGRDVLEGGSGNDSLNDHDSHYHSQSLQCSRENGVREPDVMVGGPGADQIQSRGRGDRIDAGSGDDRVSVSGSGIRVVGGAGNDDLTAHFGINMLLGGPGHDHIVLDHAIGGTLRGGPGVDQFHLFNMVDRGRRAVLVDCGSGVDRVWSTAFRLVQCERRYMCPGAEAKSCSSMPWGRPEKDPGGWR